MTPDNIDKSFKNMLIINFGGTSSSAAILSVNPTKGGIQHFEEKIIQGNLTLGSCSIIKSLYNKVICRLEENRFPKLDPEEDWDDINRILQSVIKAINNLLVNPNSTQTILRAKTKIAGNRLQKDITINKQEFEEIVNPFINEFKSLLDNTMTNGYISVKDIDAICLTGFYSQLWQFKEMINDYFVIQPLFYPDIQNITTKGACIYASSLTKGMNIIKEVNLTSNEKLNISLGIEVLNLKNRSERLFYPIMIHNIHRYGDKVMIVFPSLNKNNTSYAINIYENNTNYLRDGRILQTYVHNNLVPKEKDEPQLEVYFYLNKNGILEISSSDVEHTGVKGTTLLYNRRKVHELVIEDELNKNQQKRAERMNDVLTLRNLENFVNNDLENLYDDPEFENLVDKRRLYGSVYSLHYYIKSKMKIESWQLHSLIIEIRGLLSNYYSHKNIPLPEILSPNDDSEKMSCNERLHHQLTQNQI